MFSMISGSLGAAISRFITFELGKRDSTRLREVFCCSVNIQILLSIVIIVLIETIGVWFLNTKMIIPTGRLSAANWVLQFSILAFVVNLISIPYNAAIIAHERMSAFAYVSILEGVAKLVIAFMIIRSPIDRLIYYSILIAAVAILVRLVYGLYCSRNFEECSYYYHWNKTLFKEMLGFAGWNLIGNTANVCLIHGTNILLNAFFGPVVNAAKGVAVQVQTAVGSFCTNFQMAFNPQITKLYAEGELIRMHRLIFRASRFSYYLVLLFSVPIIMKSEAILTIWLKNPPEYAAVFVKYTMLFNLVQALASPLLTGGLATGDVKKLMSIVASFFCSVIPLGYLVLYLGGAPTSIFQLLLALYLIAHIMRLWIVSRQLHFTIKKYCREVLVSISLLSITGFIVGYFLETPFGDDLTSVVIYTIICLAIQGILIIYLGMNKNEREKIILYITSKFKS